MTLLEALEAAMSAPHTCDDACETGEEAAEKAFIDEAGRSTVIHGPADQVNAMTSIRTAWEPGILRSDVFLPVRPGRAAREEQQRRLEAENPGDTVIVDCFGGAIILPSGLPCQ